MTELNNEQLDTFIQNCRRVAEAGLLRSSSGNMSWRVADNVMAITGSGTCFESITADGVAVCRIDDETPLNSVSASVESPFHAGVLRVRPDANVVLHCQTPCATTLCCGDPSQYNFNIIPEIPVYIGEPAIVDFHLPGSEELAANTIEAAREHDMVLLRNHGQVIPGKDFEDIIRKAIFFELACEILLHGWGIRPLPESAVKALRGRVS